MSLTVTDNFCGAGGSSEGAEMVPDVKVKVALNHWSLAIDSHQSNFPNAIHECTDLSAVDPRRYPSTDIAVMSPECTNHADSNGKKKVKAQLELYDKGILDPAAERSRATMWDVCRFAEYHKYKAIIVENVVQARVWIMWDSWLHAMHALGYNHKCVYLNSMHCWPTPQSRDRMYVVFWRKGQKAPNLEYTPLAYCPCCEKDIHAVQTWKRPDRKFGRYGANAQYLYRCPADGQIVEPYYYAAFNAIDWSDRGRQIGEMNLAPNTRTRIEYGREKYGFNPLILKLENSSNKTNVRSAFDAMQTQTTCQSMAVYNPWIIEMNRTGEAKPATNSLSTLTGSLNHGVMQTPLIVTNRGESMSHPATNPMTAQTSMINHGIVTEEATNSFISYYYKCPQASLPTEPIRTIRTKQGAGIVSNADSRIEDCYYRTIKAHEVKRGMAFRDDYIIKGNQEQIVKQCGNAVTPPAMKWLVQQVKESLM